LEHVRSLYYQNDLSGPLPLGAVESLALPYESYKLAFTPGLLARIYGSRVNDPLLRDEARYRQVEFDPWRQETWDENDTVLQSRWHTERQALPATDPERRADDLTVRHAGTPTVAHLDTLGRTFLTITDNGPAGTYATRVALDIEGNQRSMTDARGLTVMTYNYDMLNQKVHQVSMDAGEHWMFNNVVGKPVRAWDSRTYTFRTLYDLLQRPTHLFVQQGSNA